MPARRFALALLLAAAFSLLASQLPGMHGGLLHLLPAIVLLLPLIGARYPGERQLARLARTRRPSFAYRRRAPAVIGRAPRHLPVAIGDVLACALAGRAPPQPLR